MSPGIHVPAVRTRALTKVYRSRAVVAGLDLDIPAGALSLVLGPNGCGKTTTFRLLLGLDRPTSGTVEILGHSAQHPERYLPDVGALVGVPAAYPQLSGRRNLQVLARLSGRDEARIDETLDVVGLGERAEDKFGHYSMGMRLRLGLAAALLNRPRLLLLDEPLNGLDSVGVSGLRELLRDLADTGQTVVVSSHLLAELDTVADYLVILRSGQCVFQGTRPALDRLGGPSIQVTPEDPAMVGALAQIARDAGHGVAVSGSRVDVRAPHEWSSELNHRAMAMGIRISSLTMSKPTLADLANNVLIDPSASHARE